MATQKKKIEIISPVAGKFKISASVGDCLAIGKSSNQIDPKQAEYMINHGYAKLV